MVWNPDDPAVFVQLAPNGLAVSLVRHDGYPYQEDWDESATSWDGLFDIANRYVKLVNTRLNLPQQWLDDLTGGTSHGERPFGVLRWLRDRSDPRQSYWVERQSGLADVSRPETGPTVDRTAVLLACLCAPKGDPPLFGGQGLRVLVHAGPPQLGTASVRITGVASTLPPPKSIKVAAQTSVELSVLIKLLFGLQDDTEIVDLGLRLPEGTEHPIVFAKTAPKPSHLGGQYAEEAISYQLAMRLNFEVPGFLEAIARRPLVAFADADVLVRDPVSKFGAAQFTARRPGRPSSALDPARDHVSLGNLPPGGAGMVQLVDPDPNMPPKPDFQVLNSRLVDLPAPESSPREVPPSTNEHVRTNTFAAVNAFYHTRILFDHMRAYGLPPAQYFRFVSRPIDVRYRAGILPGAGDGRTVNAQVLWRLRPDASHMGTIEVRFALGDLGSAVGRLPANLPSAAERSPLGVAADPRWCWHEYGHVLLTAAVGDLELRFAHSAGDAMGAILSDPDSELAKDRSGALANDGAWRGLSFPWVLIPRRHDRRPQDGWSWTGPMNRREIYFTVPGLSDKRGYWTEQILSSSLFRLYRAIGGDSEVTVSGQLAPARPERRQAADYVVYLIMRAIESLGAAAVTPATTPDVFVDVMRKADTATATAPGPGGYVGGTVHKVVQWAFERQGLYGLPVPTSPVSGPEEQATVDLHIDDRRPKRDGPYSPVDLLGTAWHARLNSLYVTKSIFWWVRTRRVYVRVQNRGADAALGTQVEVWVAPVTAGTGLRYPDAAWQSLGQRVRRVPGRTGQVPGQRLFGPFTWTPPEGPAQDYAILAAATCAADRSNIDPATGHPCLSIPSPVHILVACDNNLGLRTVTIS